MMVVVRTIVYLAKLVLLAAVACALVLAAAQWAANEGSKGEALQVSGTTVETMVAPLDAVARDVVETATFSLG